MIDVGALLVVATVLTVLLFIYLFVALLFPERLS